MRRYLLLLTILCSTASHAQTYTTNFPGTENPISESGNWINGLATGTHWQNMQTFGGHAGGTGVNPGCTNPSPNNNCNDGVANLNGNYGAQQSACATVYINGLSRTAGTYELELHLHQTTTSGQSKGYEFNYSLFNNGNQYMQVVRWDGFVGGGITFVQIGGTSGAPVALQNGDLFCATSSATGSLQSTLTRGGVVVQSTTPVTDTTYTGGAPGIGSFNGGGVAADNANFGFSNFTAQGGCNIENFLDYESGTNGTNATAALLNSSTHGYATSWTTTQTGANSIIFSSSANRPLRQATGVLCGNNTNYPAGAGTLGVEFVGQAVLGANEVEGPLPAQLRLPHFHESVWFCFQFPRGSINYDIYDVHPSNGNFVAINVHDIGAPNPYFNMETGDGNAATTVPINFSTSCTGPGANWFQAVLTLGQSGAEPHSMSVYNTDGNLVGSVSLPSTNAGSPALSVYTAGGGVTANVPVGQNVYVDSWQMADLSVPIEPVLNQPICQAPTATPADVQAAINSCGGKGTIVVPFTAGTTWGGTQITANLTGPLTIQGQTISTVGGAPGSQGVGLAYTDNTIINTSVTTPSLVVNNCNSTNIFRLTGMTFNNTGSTGVLSGVVEVNCTHGQTNAARIDHLHVTSTNGVFLSAYGWGLTDHILFNATNTNAYSYWILNGDFNSGGFLDWQQPTNLGTAENWILEDSNLSGIGSTAVTDGQFGCKGLIRHNQITNMGAGQTHGYDSGGFRSCVGMDLDSNTFNNTAGFFSPWNGSRGGYVLFHGNNLIGTNLWNPIELDYFRSNIADINGSQWGLVQAGLNWTPASTATCGGGCPGNAQNPQASAWTTGVHAAHSVVNGSGRNFQTVAGGTSTGSAPNFAGVGAIGGTVTDSGGVIWEYVGGSVTAPPGTTGTNAGFLNTDNETQCSSGVNCTRFVDNNGGTWPFRDQPCVIHGQVTGWCYQWGNTGAKFPTAGNLGAPWNTDAPSTVLQLNRDVFNAQPAGYAPYQYPDPLQGGSVPAIPGVGFSPTSINFGSVTIGTTSSTQTITVTNTGTANLTFGPTGTTSPGGVSFNPVAGGAPPCPISGTLTPGASCMQGVNVTVNSGSGIANGTFNFPSNVSGSPQTVPLSVNVIGNTASVSIAPASGSFGTSTTPIVFTVTSNGPANLVMGTPPITFGGANPDFNVSGGGGACTGGQAISPGNSCTATVTFHPGAVGSRTGNMNVNDNVAGSPQVIPLTGTGIATASVNPLSLVFGNVIVNQSQNQSVTLQNTGNVALTITSIVMTGATFSQMNNCAASLGAGLSCTVLVTFSPVATGTGAGTLTITDNSSTGSTQVVTATGNGILVPVVATGVVLQCTVQ